MTESNRRKFLVALTILVAATRLLALSRSVWDWDEGLFLSSLRDYDVVVHHPHPPGFPLFVATAKLARVFIHDDFHALRAVSLLSSFLIFPLFYAMARAFRFPFHTSVIAALLFSVLPNVWFWGGTAFSDVFAIVLFLAAAAALLLHDERRWSYMAGGVLFAATLLVRPQNVLMAYPWLLASWRRLRARRIGEVVACAAVITFLVLGGYGLAAHASGGWRKFMNATIAHQKYVATVDGSLNPNRPVVGHLLHDFAVDPVLAGVPFRMLGVFAVAAFLPPRRRDFDVLLTFIPNFLVALFMLSITGVSRLSLAYLPMHALLAADGMNRIAALFAKRERTKAAIQWVFAAPLVALFVIWIWPALAEVRRHDSPPMRAIFWIRQNVPRVGNKIYVQGAMEPFARYYLTDYTWQIASDDFDPASAPEELGAFWTADRQYRSPRAQNFRRDERRLWGLFHRRYFQACVVPVLGGPRWVSGWVRFGEGWYYPEFDENGKSYRWMGGRGRLFLQSLAGPGELSLQLYAPIDAEPPPMVTVSFAGSVVERFRLREANFHRTYRLASSAKTPGNFLIQVDGVVVPARLGQGADQRKLGLRINGVSWKALLR